MCTIDQIVKFGECVAVWDFSEPAGSPRRSRIGEPLKLRECGGGIPRIPEGPLSGYAACLNGASQYFSLPHAECGPLNIHGPDVQVSVLAWIRWDRPNIGFLGGIWQEDDQDPRRQYGLFVHLPSYGGERNVCGHVSYSGGNSPGLPYSRDYSANRTPVPLGEWSTVAFTYDGQQVRSYLNGQFEPRPEYQEPGPPLGKGLRYAKNPYAWPHGLGNNGGDFTVGAVQLTSGMGNFFAGAIGGLAVYRSCLHASCLQGMRTGNSIVQNT